MHNVYSKRESTVVQQDPLQFESAPQSYQHRPAGAIITFMKFQPFLKPAALPPAAPSSSSKASVSFNVHINRLDRLS